MIGIGISYLPNAPSAYCSTCTASPGSTLDLWFSVTNMGDQPVAVREDITSTGLTLDGITPSALTLPGYPGTGYHVWQSIDVKVTIPPDAAPGNYPVEAIFEGGSGGNVNVAVGAITEVHVS